MRMVESESGTEEKKEKKLGEKLADETFIIKFFDFCIGFVHTVLPFKAASDWYLKLEKKKEMYNQNRYEQMNTFTYTCVQTHIKNLLKTGYFTVMNRQTKQNEAKCN